MKWAIFIGAVVSGFLTLFAIGYLRFGRDLEEAHSAVGIDALIAVTAIGSIQYADRGSGDVVLSVHGSGGGFDQGLRLAGEMLPDGFRILAPSRFGYLETPAPSDTSATAQAQAHAALLDALNIETAIVMGTSAGALSAVEFASLYPARVRALILVAPATFTPQASVSIESSRGSDLAFRLVNAGANALWWTVQRISPQTLVRFLGVPPLVYRTASEAEQRRVMLWVDSVQPLSKRVRGINIDSKPPLVRPKFEAITAPTLIVAARDDLFNTAAAADYAASMIAQAQLVIFPTGGHLLVGRHRTVRRLVVEFLRSL